MEKSPTHELLLAPQKNDRLDLKGQGVSSQRNLNRKSRIKDSMKEGQTVTDRVTLTNAKSKAHGKTIRPVVTVEEKTGIIKTESEFVRGRKDEYGLTGNNLIDNYCTDEKGKMLIYETK